jgi:hypothetical protein
LFAQQQTVSAGYVASKYALANGPSSDASGNGLGGSNANYNFYLQYDAGSDATQMVRDMTVAVRQSQLTEA